MFEKQPSPGGKGVCRDPCKIKSPSPEFRLENLCADEAGWKFEK